MGETRREAEEGRCEWAKEGLVGPSFVRWAFRVGGTRAHVQKLATRGAHE
jgi:hypothetical protein